MVIALLKWKQQQHMTKKRLCKYPFNQSSKILDNGTVHAHYLVFARLLKNNKVKIYMVLIQQGEKVKKM